MRYLSENTRNSPRRDGIVLLVVIAMLTLFAVVALSFVFYADAEAVASEVNRDAQALRQADVDVEALAGFALGQVIYPTDNIYSALRGHELARSIYGYNPAVLNYIPYNGIGRSAYAPLGDIDGDLGISRYAMINYQTFWDPLQLVNNQKLNFVRTPEYYGKYFFGTVPGTAPPSPSHLAPAGPANDHRYVGGANPPWTAFDANNMFLAEIKADDGTILRRSFDHPQINAANILWAGTPGAKYTSLRPDLSWNYDPNNPANNRIVMVNGVPITTSFYTPDSDAGGDVKNFEGGKGYLGGNNDSIWVDLGHPVMTGPDGRRFKPLFAFLITDLSNRLHLWAHGNRLGASPAGSHVSNLGFGPPEVNLSPLNPASPFLNPTELQNLFLLKYGAALQPAGSPVPYNPGPWYARYDFDGLDPAAGRGSFAMFTGFSTTSQGGGVIGTNTMQVTNITSLLPTPAVTVGAFPWAVQANMFLAIDTGANAETVQVASVNTATSSFVTVANFAKNHAAGVPVFYSYTPPPSPVAVGPFFAFPSYPAGWDNGNNLGGQFDEITKKPLGFNPWMAAIAPTGEKNLGPLPLSNMEAILRRGGTNSPWVTSEIYRLMPNSFNPTTPLGLKAGNLVTLWNPHLDRITASPVISWDPDTTGKYTLVATPYPRVVTFPIPPPAYNTPSVYPAKSEFNADWRSNLGTQLRVNLNRPLANYPAPAVGTNVITNMAAFTTAQTDRQQFAKDIYNALVRVTGAQDPNTAPIANVSATSDDYRAARWLAQLAVNIVDYIDNDDYCTPFNWNHQAYLNSVNGAIDEWVFGTELPRLVLNEALALYDNDPTDPLIVPPTPTATTARNRLNVWAELHNPFKSTPAGDTFPRDNGAATLRNTAVATPFDIYQLVAAKSLAGELIPLATLMRDPANNLGDPDFSPGAMSRVLSPFAGWGADILTRQVLPANGVLSGTINKQMLLNATTVLGNNVTFTTTAAHNFKPGQTVVIAGFTGYNGSFPIQTAVGSTFSVFNPINGLTPAPAPAGATASVGGNNGFFVLGPNANFLPTRDPNLPTTYSNASMSIVNPPGGAAIPPAIAPVTLVLRRLANPHLPPDNTQASATYNPYITVDYMAVPVPFVLDNRQYDAAGLNGASPGPVTVFASRGRKQPYAADSSQVFAQTASPVANQPKNSFFSHNDNRETPFTWLTHLDRPLVNQLELLHVSAFKPHELTQQFITNALGGKKFQHYAPWGHVDNPLVGGAQASSHIFRALDVLGTPNNMLGNLRGGRWQGNINLNTIDRFDKTILFALADPQDFVTLPPPPPPYSPFTTPEVNAIYPKIITSRQAGGAFGDGTPFKSFAAGNINDTLLRPDPTNPAQSLFAVGSSVNPNHPYQRNTLLQKIFNNVTTTSNTFAVWTTVGFFEVVDETVRPPRLGAEIGRSENRHIRHRFFAIVDRSGLQLYNTISTNAVVGATSTWNIAQTYAVNDVVVYNGANYTCIQAGAGNVPTNAAFWTQVSMSHDLANVNTGNGKIAPWNNTQSYGISNTVSSGNSAYLCIQPNTNISPTPATPANAAYWQPILQPGMLLEIDTGANAEVVVVTAVANNSFTANFRLNHAASVPIVCRGNPGPKTNFNPATPTVPAYNPRQDTNVVLHLSVIQ